MPSPFPGMDPYLEAPDIWPDFHHGLAGEIRDGAERHLAGRATTPTSRCARSSGSSRSGGAQRIVPDIVVVRHPTLSGRPRGGGVAVATRSRREISPYDRSRGLDRPVRHLFVEIRDPARGHKLITLIEILSPSNKRPAPTARRTRAKQREVLKSDASLIELDLLRGGRRIVPDLAPRGDDRTVETVADLRRPGQPGVATQRRRRSPTSVYPVGLREPLPCISVPLKEGEDEILLDLQYVFNRVYDTGPYRRGAVDYAGPVPAPALDKEDAAWAAELTRPWREARAAGT